MDGKKRGSVQQTYNIRRDLVERMDKYRKEHGVMKVFLVERAIEEYLDRVAPEKGSETAARPVSDGRDGRDVVPAGDGEGRR